MSISFVHVKLLFYTVRHATTMCRRISPSVSDKACCLMTGVLFVPTFPSPLHTLRRRKAVALPCHGGLNPDPANAQEEGLVVTINHTPLMHESSSSGTLDCLNTPLFRTCSHEKSLQGLSSHTPSMLPPPFSWQLHCCSICAIPTRAATRNLAHAPTRI